MRIRDVFQRIDFQRLAGIKSILGVDLTEERVHVVELLRQGNPLDRFHPRFNVLNSFSQEFDPKDSLDERAKKLKALLLTRGTKTRFAISGVQSVGIKTVTATIPSNIEDVDEWIQEHYDKLVKLPLSPDQISYTFEILERAETGTLIEVTFIRKSEVQQCKTFFREAGLELLALGAGTRDILTAFMLSESYRPDNDIDFLYVDGNSFSLTSFVQGKRSQVQFSGFSSTENPGLSIQKFVEQAEASSKSLVVAGRLDGSLANYRLLQPFGLSSEYALAVGLAMKGFLPEASPTNLLQDSDKEHIQNYIYRSLTHKAAIILGSTIFVMLTLQVLAAFILDAKLNALDEQLVSSDTAYAQVAALEQQVRSLESRIEGDEASFRRTNFAKILHDVASLTPKDIWLKKLTIDEKETRGDELAISGFAKSGDDIADFLKNLQQTGFCSDVNLIRSGSSLSSESAIAVKQRRSPFVMFEVKATIKN